MPDGTSEKIDATAMDLHFGPLKGKVTGKNTGKKFFVTSLTGLGTAAAYLVGSGGGNGFNGPISESTLLRERVANNIGIAGDQQLTNLAYNQNIVVTVPGNTRFYLVIQKGSGESNAPKGLQPASANSAQLANAKLPTLEELSQLMQLRQELSQLYQQPAQSPATSASQPPPGDRVRNEPHLETSGGKALPRSMRGVHVPGRCERRPPIQPWHPA